MRSNVFTRSPETNRRVASGHYIRDRARLATVVGATNEAVIGITNDGRNLQLEQSGRVIVWPLECGRRRPDAHQHCFQAV